MEPEPAAPIVVELPKPKNDSVRNFSIPTRDGQMLDITLHTPIKDNPTGAAIVFPAHEECFHEETQNDEEDTHPDQWSEWYCKRGLYAVCVHSSRQSELGHYFDAQVTSLSNIPLCSVLTFCIDENVSILMSLHWVVPCD